MRVERIEAAVLPMARAALDAGQVQTAKRLYTRLLDVDPGSAEARIGIGDVHLAERETRQAMTWYLSAVSHARAPPVRHTALLAHARAALAAGEVEAARASFERLTDTAEGATEAEVAWGWNGIGVLHLVSGNASEAVAAFERAALRDPDELMFQDNLARAVRIAYEAGEQATATETPDAAFPTPALPDAPTTTSREDSETTNDAPGTTSTDEAGEDTLPDADEPEAPSGEDGTGTSMEDGEADAAPSEPEPETSPEPNVTEPPREGTATEPRPDNDAETRSDPDPEGAPTGETESTLDDDSPGTSSEDLTQAQTLADILVNEPAWEDITPPPSPIAAREQPLSDVPVDTRLPDESPDDSSGNPPSEDGQPDEWPGTTPQAPTDTLPTPPREDVTLASLLPPEDGEGLPPPGDGGAILDNEWPGEKDSAIPEMPPGDAEESFQGDGSSRTLPGDNPPQDQPEPALEDGWVDESAADVLPEVAIEPGGAFPSAFVVEADEGRFVQVGAFVADTRADAIAARLRARTDLPIRIRPTESDGRLLFLVRLGPVPPAGLPEDLAIALGIDNEVFAPIAERAIRVVVDAETYLQVGVYADYDAAVKVAARARAETGNRVEVRGMARDGDAPWHRVLIGPVQPNDD